MACIRCGSRWAEPIIKGFRMKDYLIARGWTFTGTNGCGCGGSNNQQWLRNGASYKVMLNEAGTTFSLVKLGIVPSTVSTGNTTTFQANYDQYFPNEK
jgi:hypothetical protein